MGILVILIFCSLEFTIWASGANEQQDRSDWSAKEFVEDVQNLPQPQVHVIQKRSSTWGNYEGADVDELFANFGTNREVTGGEETEDSGRSWGDHGHHGHHHEDRSRNNGRRNRRRKERRRNRNRSREVPTLPTAFPSLEPPTTETRGRPQEVHAELKHPGNVTRQPHRGPTVNSGQFLRLAGGTHISGRLEVYINGHWGVICDDDWDLKDAHVACKHLGFTQGAKAAMGGSSFGYAEFGPGDILLDDVNCHGNESVIHECKHLTQHDCTLTELASVECIPNSGCEDGWVSGNGLCYKLMPQLATFERAATKCEEIDARLVNIESQKENDFLSSWLSSATNETYFFTGGVKITDDGLEYWKWHGTPYHVNFTKWFPGWPPNGTHIQPSNHSGQDCITLARRFYDEKRQATDVGYYFWNDAPCTVRLPFVCERVAKSKDCYDGLGLSYRGTVFRTERGTLCQNWSASSKINGVTHPNKGLGNHNYCRNPDNDSRPWCWVSAADNRFGFCGVEICDSSVTKAVSTAPTTTEAPDVNNQCDEGEFLCRQWFGSGRCIPGRWRCDGDEDCTDGEDEHGCHSPAPPTIATTTCQRGNLMCNSTKVCIPTRWRCDGDRDCSGGEDEKNCGSDIEKLKKTADRKLLVRTGDRIINQVTYVNTGLRECARLCLQSKNFICRSFNLRMFPQECSLTTLNSAMTGTQLIVDQNFDYYEVIIQAENCTKRRNLFLCDNGRCIERHFVCDGTDQCHDFSDEEACETAMGLRLVGGTSESEGRVEVRHLGEWGVVCDDNWDLLDANVVCRQLGYSGAIRSTTMAHFGSGNGNFLLDEVECKGTETSLDECRRDPWKKHDCLGYETAGVQCRTRKVCDEETEMRCGDESCIPSSFVCDGENDCSDGSDERDCNVVKVELVGGDSPNEGRVELIVNKMRGTVCDDGFDNDAAKVICRMLGIRGPAFATYFGGGRGHIILDNVACKGQESSIAECKHNGWGVHNCEHREDIGVKCGAPAMPKTTPGPSVVFEVPQTTNGSVPSCGWRPIIQPTTRVVGGYTTIYGAFPWQAGVQKRGWLGGHNHHCGATIVSNRWLLSAAHCFENRPKEAFRVKVGDYDVGLADLHQQTFEVEEVIMHNGYNTRTNDYDFALIKVAGVIRMSDHVQPVCLPQSEEVYRAGMRCAISGWGSTNGHGSPRKLKAAMVPLISRPVCRQLYKFALSDRMFCAGFLEGNIDSCQGDSGGPLVCRVNGSYTLMGVTSWGMGCAQPNSPGVYAKVVKVVQWISNTIK